MIVKNIICKSNMYMFKIGGGSYGNVPRVRKILI